MAKLTPLQEAYVRTLLQNSVNSIRADMTDGEIFKFTRNFLDALKESGVELEENLKFYNVFRNRKNELRSQNEKN